MAAGNNASSPKVMMIMRIKVVAILLSLALLAACPSSCWGRRPGNNNNNGSSGGGGGGSPSNYRGRPPSSSNRVRNYGSSSSSAPPYNPDDDDGEEEYNHQHYDGDYETPRSVAPERQGPPSFRGGGGGGYGDDGQDAPEPDQISDLLDEAMVEDGGDGPPAGAGRPSSAAGGGGGYPPHGRNSNNNNNNYSSGGGPMQQQQDGYYDGNNFAEEGGQEDFNLNNQQRNGYPPSAAAAADRGPNRGSRSRSQQQQQGGGNRSSRAFVPRPSSSSGGRNSGPPPHQRSGSRSNNNSGSRSNNNSGYDFARGGSSSSNSRNVRGGRDGNSYSYSGANAIDSSAATISGYVHELEEREHSPVLDGEEDDDLDFVDGEGNIHAAGDGDDDDHHFMDGLLSGAGKEALYEAYNQLHTLAQEYDKPFDAPAVVVVGHQSSGKSALIEALMGFQFNQVGGGTKTRRPVALRLQYNPKCREPRWYLIGEDGVERSMGLSEIQDYIEKENRRLEQDPTKSFESKEINIRMEYRHCPNMILIDTPGLIAAPRIPKGRGGGPGSALAQQRAQYAAAREAEQLVVDKMRCEDYIILCVEDQSDWKHGATREIVQKADPELTRTVIVNTKFDTKVPQFGTASDVEDFLRAGVLDSISPHRLGGPFFTSVPSGRVGRAFGSNKRIDGDYDYAFSSDEHFVKACSDAESDDRAVSLQRLKRSNNRVGEKVAAAGLTSRIGISRLRSFLEQRVDECYRRNVRKIIPMLQAEYVTTERRLEACETELEALSIERLKAGAEAFCDEFCSCLRKAIQGSIVAPPSLFGETLKQEAAAAGSFHAVQGCPMAVSDRTWDRLVDTEVGGRSHRLYGGSQYHRTLREFNLATRCLRLSSLQEDEIINAAGLGETHDGVNYLHAACTIAVEKARSSFDPLLEALQMRMKHVFGRLCPVAEYMLRETRDRNKRTSFSQSSQGDDPDDISGSSVEQTMDISQNPQFKQLIRTIFDKFVNKCSESASSKCRDDITAITRYVSWNLDDRSGSGFSRALPDQTDVLSVYQVVLKARGGSPALEDLSSGGGAGRKNGKSNENADPAAAGELTESKPSAPMLNSHRDIDRDYRSLLMLMEEAVMTRDARKTTMLVGGLVQHIVANWQLHFCRSVTSKFNCYFMLPFVDEFHRFMRRELQKVYEGDNESLSDVFDLTAARRALQKQREELINECLANKQLQEKFRTCTRMMKSRSDGKGSSYQQPYTLRPELILEEG